jgi:hypothetical protein
MWSSDVKQQPLALGPGLSARIQLSNRIHLSNHIYLSTHTNHAFLRYGLYLILHPDCQVKRTPSNRLKSMEHRTDLWLYLTFDIIQQSPSELRRRMDIENRFV